MRKSTALGWWLLVGLLFGGASSTGVLLVKEVEYRLFPVVSDVQITRSEQDGSSLLIWGTFNKNRDCRFVEAVALAGPLSLDLEFLDARPHQAASRLVGPQTFGPWRITPSLSPLRIVARHSCHSLWQTTSTMIESYKL